MLKVNTVSDGSEVTTELWQDYRRGKDYLDSINLFSRVEECHNYVNGDQWKGLKYGNERPPQLNILMPMMKTSTALVGQNTMTINYTSLNYGSSRDRLLTACKLLDREAKRIWEKTKLDSGIWNILQDAYIGGDVLQYFYMGDDNQIVGEQIDTTNFMLGDEQQPDIQKQPYIIFVQRKNIDDVKKLAKASGVAEEDIKNIYADNDTELQINGETEVKNDKKVTLLAKLYKKDGYVWVSRATKSVVVQPPTEIKGMKLYPVAKYTWKPRKGLARGDGDIWDKIPNQRSINKALFRLEQAMKSTSYPKQIYLKDAISASQIEQLDMPGAKIAVNGRADTPITSKIAYLQPADISPIAVSYWKDLITLTRELAGSGDNLDNINPEQASGTAIAQAREAKSLNVNMQVRAYKQFVEDCARIWYEMLCIYNPDGLYVVDDDDKQVIIPAATLAAMQVDVKIDVLPSDNSYIAQQDYYLKEALSNGWISFEEYVEALSEESMMPKAKLEKIVQKRQETMEL